MNLFIMSVDAAKLLALVILIHYVIQLIEN